MFPLPFGRITIYVGRVIDSRDKVSEEGLEKILNELPI